MHKINPEHFSQHDVYLYQKLINKIQKYKKETEESLWK